MQGSRGATLLLEGRLCLGVNQVIHVWVLLTRVKYCLRASLQGHALLQLVEVLLADLGHLRW